MSLGVMKTALEALTCKSAAQRTEQDGTVLRKTPLLNRVYTTRSKLMHKLVNCGLKSHNNLNQLSEEPPQLLILGAGLDVSYNSYPCRTFAVDFESVLSKRSSTDNMGTAVCLVPGDLRFIETVLLDLIASGFDVSAPTVILLECVLSYIDQTAAPLLLESLSSQLKLAIMIMYDPILPHKHSNTAGMASMMFEKFAERGAPLLSCAENVPHFMRNLREAGWTHVTAVSVNQAAQLFLSAAERAGGLPPEPFDEFASLALLQDCYAIGVACTDSVVFQRLQQLLYASKTSAAERLQSLQDRVALAEACLASVEAHIKQQQEQRPTKTIATPSAIRIRAAQIKDTHTLVQVYQSAFESAAEKYSSVRKYVKFSLKALKEFEKTYDSSQGSVLFVAEGEDGAVVGCLGVKIKQVINGDGADGAAGVAELSHFCVAQSHQRGGVGHALLTRALAYCRQTLPSAQSSVVCLTVLRDLEAARRLYASKGFEHVNTEKLGNDCELYNLRLSCACK